ncbi:hypothetical protein ACS5PU_16350 [Pedobacter sp. GSP4]|uniref:hypothetical protein n=1 Tax=Pedobacter sp. GSP4 TaxID=3453716 RepID=UPI003EEAFCDA
MISALSASELAWDSLILSCDMLLFFQWLAHGSFDGAEPIPQGGQAGRLLDDRPSLLIKGNILYVFDQVPHDPLRIHLIGLSPDQPERVSNP